MAAAKDYLLGVLAIAWVIGILAAGGLFFRACTVSLLYNPEVVAAAGSSLVISAAAGETVRWRVIGTTSGTESVGGEWEAKADTFQVLLSTEDGARRVFPVDVDDRTIPESRRSAPESAVNVEGAFTLPAEARGKLHGVLSGEILIARPTGSLTYYRSLDRVRATMDITVVPWSESSTAAHDASSSRSWKAFLTAAAAVVFVTLLLGFLAYKATPKV